MDNKMDNKLAIQAERTSLLLVAAATISASAGLIHFAVVGEHWDGYRAAAVFFVALGLFQVVWAALVLGRPGPRLYAAGAAVSLGTIAVWAVSRTTGLPFGPFAGIPERMGRADVISTVLEEALVVAIILLAFGPRQHRPIRAQLHRAGLAGIVGVTALLALWALTGVSTGGDHIAAHAGGGGLLAHLGHHGLHLVFAGGAVAFYLGYLVAHIRRHGWPSFSWKLNPGLR